MRKLLIEMPDTRPTQTEDFALVEDGRCSRREKAWFTKCKSMEMESSLLGPTLDNDKRQTFLHLRGIGRAGSESMSMHAWAQALPHHLHTFEEVDANVRLSLYLVYF